MASTWIYCFRCAEVTICVLLLPTLQAEFRRAAASPKFRDVTTHLYQAAELQTLFDNICQSLRFALVTNNHNQQHMLTVYGKLFVQQVEDCTCSATQVHRVVQCELPQSSMIQRWWSIIQQFQWIDDGLNISSDIEKANNQYIACRIAHTTQSCIILKITKKYATTYGVPR